MKKNYLDKVVTESINRIITESEMDFGNLYELKDGSDITKYVMDYISWSQRGQKDPSFSILASKLHDALMYTLMLDHGNEEDRKAFVKVLNYCKDVNRTVGIEKIEYLFSTSPWVITTKNGDEFEKDIYIDIYDFKDDSMTHWHLLRYAIAYKTDDGVQHISTDYRPGSCNGSCGYVTTSAAMTDEMKQHIYDMGLVPALFNTGSYHENWVYAVGILPKYVTQIKNSEELEDTIFFECEF